jgi:adenylate cyclase
MRRIFEDEKGNKLEQLDLWEYGYDPRERPWYVSTMKAGRPVVSSPYVAFSIGAPLISISAPLKGSVRGVIAADLKLDDFSNFVEAQRPGEHGTIIIFDKAGMLIAHPNFAQFVADAMTHPSQPQLINIKGTGRIDPEGLERQRSIRWKYSQRARDFPISAEKSRSR